MRMPWHLRPFRKAGAEEGPSDARFEGLDYGDMSPARLNRLVEDAIAGSPDLTIRVPGNLRAVQPSALPSWWARRNNVALSVAEIEKLPVAVHVGQDPPRNALVVLGENYMLGKIILWGNGSVVLLGDHVRLPSSMIACGTGAKVLIGGQTSCTGNASINARNGGEVLVGERGLWATGVGLYTDDMHAIRDLATGRRLNGMGGRIVVSDHVWLAYQALVLRTVSVGHDSVIGARSVVRGAVPANCVAAGVPARVVRQGVTWDFNDLP